MLYFVCYIRDLNNLLFSKNINVRIFHSNPRGLKKALCVVLGPEKTVSSVNRVYTSSFWLTNVVGSYNCMRNDTVVQFALYLLPTILQAWFVSKSQ